MRKSEISHKTFAKEAPFPSSESKRTKHHFLINWRQISKRKMGFAAEGEATVGLFSYIINYLRLRACGQNAITSSCVRRRFWEVNIPNHFDDSLYLRYFRTTKTTFQILWIEIGPLVSPVMPKQSPHDLLKQSHTILF